jgi:hypothetical protein
VSPTALPIKRIRALLAAGPSHIAEFTTGLTETQLHAAPGPGEWSGNEVLAHLRSCSDVWGSCIVTIISQATPTIRAVNPRTWIKSTSYLEQKFQSSLQAFTAQRVELLAVLEPLKPRIWSRSATITGAGKRLERSVHFFMHSGWQSMNGRT